MKCTPFRPVVPFGEELLSLPLEAPSLKSFPRPLKMRFMQAPRKAIFSVSTNPLSIEIDVYIDIEASLDVYCYIRSRYGLTKGGGRSNRRKEGNEDFEVV